LVWRFALRAERLAAEEEAYGCKSHEDEQASLRLQRRKEAEAAWLEALRRKRRLEEGRERTRQEASLRAYRLEQEEQRRAALAPPGSTPSAKPHPCHNCGRPIVLKYEDRLLFQMDANGWSFAYHVCSEYEAAEYRSKKAKWAAEWAALLKDGPSIGRPIRAPSGGWVTCAQCGTRIPRGSPCGSADNVKIEGWVRKLSLTRACSRRAGGARGAARAEPSSSAAKEAKVCAGAGMRARR
jgi:hypothetical protein